ncbi:hypothetical protein OG554_05405 [Streptomyces griseus]|uniref:hypothetical protein n=1 Tax=Streptomyces griseus TaxID=1911 RepID=UPI0038709061|nr:hypothetical protein OG554_05405 [Streptomyces fimicarius]
MNQPDSSALVACFQGLGVDFAGLRSTVLGLEIAPGPPARHTLSALFYRAQGMATRLAAQHLRVAAHQLELCSTVCRHVAHGISRKVSSTAAAVPDTVQLNTKWYGTLNALAKAGAGARPSGRSGR